MATPKIQIAPKLVAEGKRLYETTMTTIADIAALMGVSRRTLENRIVEWNWKRRRQPSGAIDIFHAVRGAAAAVATAETPPPDAAIAAPALAQQRAALAQRIQNVVEREMAVVERVVNLLGPADESGAERSARTLAAVARTLQEMAALTKPEAEVMPPDDADDDDPIPRDINEFRRELARRIRNFIEARRLGAGRILDQRESEVD